MMKIPEIENGKVVVIRADDKTGKILNNNNSFYNNEGDDYFIIIDNLMKARIYAFEEIKKGLVEILIYDDNGDFVEVHRI